MTSKEILELEARCKLIGTNCIVFKAEGYGYKKSLCALIHDDNANVNLIISDETASMPSLQAILAYHKITKDKGLHLAVSRLKKVIVTGGKGLINTSWLFESIFADELDITGLSVENVENMEGMFRNSLVYSFKHNMKNSKCTSFYEMFCDFALQVDASDYDNSRLDLSGLAPEHVENCRRMFSKAQLPKILDIHNFKLDDADIEDMFTPKYTDDIRFIVTSDPRLIKLIEKLRMKSGDDSYGVLDTNGVRLV